MPKDGSRRVWCNKDTPMERRVAASTLLGLRYLLTTLGFEKKYLKVDGDTGTLKAGGKMVVKVSVDDYTLNLEWINE
eukprot:7040296-Pyramimonas_sp.AAC.1